MDAVNLGSASSISIKEAVKIAQNNNFMGLICCSRLLVRRQALSDHRAFIPNGNFYVSRL